MFWVVEKNQQKAFLLFVCFFSCFQCRFKFVKVFSIPNFIFNAKASLYPWTVSLPVSLPVCGCHPSPHWFLLMTGGLAHQPSAARSGRSGRGPWSRRGVWRTPPRTGWPRWSSRHKAATWPPAAADTTNHIQGTHYSFLEHTLLIGSFCFHGHWSDTLSWDLRPWDPCPGTPPLKPTLGPCSVLVLTSRNLFWFSADSDHLSRDPPSSGSCPPPPAGTSDSSSAAAPPSGTDTSPGETWRWSEPGYLRQNTGQKVSWVAWSEVKPVNNTTSMLIWWWGTSGGASCLKEDRHPKDL